MYYYLFFVVYHNIYLFELRYGKALSLVTEFNDLKRRGKVRSSLGGDHLLNY